MNIIIRIATKRDIQVIKKLLTRANLYDGGVEENIEQFLVAEKTGDDTAHIIGVTGFEQKGDAGFLRSFVMESESWNGLIGLDFITAILSYAEQKEVKELYLLTHEKSKPFFEHLSFKAVTLDEVPEAIRTTPHFRHSYKESVMIMKSYEQVY